MKKLKLHRVLDTIAIVITLCLALLTIIGSYAQYIPPSHSILIPIIGLFLPILLLLNIPIIIYWGFQKKYWLLLPILAIGSNWGYINSIYQIQFDKKKVPSDYSNIKIATYNVFGFGKEADGHSCKNIAGYMAKANVDIICFQEFEGNETFTVDSIKKTFSKWKYSIITPDSLHLLPLAIFSKYPINDSKLLTYPNSKNSSIWGEISIEGKQIRVFNNHLQTTNISEIRKKIIREQKENSLSTKDIIYEVLRSIRENSLKREIQAKAIHKVIEESPYPILLCGDFNSIPSSYIYRTVKGQLEDGFKTSGSGYAYSYRYYKRMLRIDYIFHSHDIQGIHYHSPSLDFSDHNPVIMEVGIKR